MSETLASIYQIRELRKELETAFRSKKTSVAPER